MLKMLGLIKRKDAIAILKQMQSELKEQVNAGAIDNHVDNIIQTIVNKHIDKL